MNLTEQSDWKRYDQKLPAADRRRLRSFCLNVLDAMKDRAAGETLCRKGQRLMRRCVSATGRALLQQWLLEWSWQQGMALPGPLYWPEEPLGRIRMLQACLNGAALPPAAAWEWLAGTAIAEIEWEAWPAVWTEARAALTRAEAGTSGLCSRQEICLMAGTPGAMIHTWHLARWRHDHLRGLFRQGLEHARRCMQAGTSRLEQAWWRQLLYVFPDTPPARHCRLPGTQMHLDFYWPAHRIGLEIQGEQHWRPIERFGGVSAFARRQERDAAKRVYCRANGIYLLEAAAGTSIADIAPVLKGLGLAAAAIPAQPEEYRIFHCRDQRD